MGLDIEFTFANGKTVDAHMCYSSFLPRILANFTQEQLKDFNLNWIGDESIPVIHTCKFVKIIYRICKKEGYIHKNMPGDPVSMIFC